MGHNPPFPPVTISLFFIPPPPLPLSLSLPIPIIVNDPFPLLSPYSSSPPPPSLSPYPPEVNTCKRDTHAPKRTYTLNARAYASFWVWVPNYPCGIAHAPIYTPRSPDQIEDMNKFGAIDSMLMAEFQRIVANFSFTIFKIETFSMVKFRRRRKC